MIPFLICPLGLLTLERTASLSADAQTLYFSTTGGLTFHSVPTAHLRDNGPYSEITAQQSMQYLGMKGLSDGLESDSNNNIYCGNMEDNSIQIFHPSIGTFTTFIRDPRFSWTDTMSVAADGYLYFTENQLWRSPSYQGGVDRRQKPYVLFRTKLPGNGTKLTQPAPI